MKRKKADDPADLVVTISNALSTGTAGLPAWRVGLAVLGPFLTWLACRPDETDAAAAPAPGAAQGGRRRKAEGAGFWIADATGFWTQGPFPALSRAKVLNGAAGHHIVFLPHDGKPARRVRRWDEAARDWAPLEPSPTECAPSAPR